MYQKTRESKALFKFSIISIAVVIVSIIAIYFFQSNSIKILPYTGSNPTNKYWNWAEKIDYDNNSNSYCYYSKCLKKEDFITNLKNEVESNNMDSTTKVAYLNLISVLKNTSDQSDCPIGYYDPTADSSSNNKKECILR